MSTIENTGVKVKLLGEDGNAFAILGRVRRAMIREKVSDTIITQYMKDATAGDYDNLLAVTMQYVEVE